MQLFIMYLRQNNPSSSKLYRYVLIYIVHNEIELEINSVENFMGTWILMWNLGHIALRPPPPFQFTDRYLFMFPVCVKLQLQQLSPVKDYNLFIV